jgi:hypothetical protein
MMNPLGQRNVTEYELWITIAGLRAQNAKTNSMGKQIQMGYVWDSYTASAWNNVDTDSASTWR